MRCTGRRFYAERPSKLGAEGSDGAQLIIRAKSAWQYCKGRGLMHEVQPRRVGTKLGGPMKIWPTVAIPDLLCATLAIAVVVWVIVYAGYLVIGRRIVTLHRLDLPRSALGTAVFNDPRTARR